MVGVERDVVTGVVDVVVVVVMVGEVVVVVVRRDFIVLLRGAEVVVDGLEVDFRVAGWNLGSDESGLREKE